MMFPDGSLLANGYSGDQAHKDDISSQKLVDEGPIPSGRYAITEPVDTAFHGPYCLGLIPDQDNMMWGRSGFLVHGDNMDHPGTASHGCIILPRFARERIWQSDDHELIVFSTP